MHSLDRDYAHGLSRMPASNGKNKAVGRVRYLSIFRLSKVKITYNLEYLTPK